MQRRAIITGTGMYVPHEVYTNHDLEKLMDTSDEWITQRSGIKERRYAPNGLGPSDLAVPAAKAALAMANLEPTDLDLIIFATLSPDYYFPGAGVFLQDHLKCGPIPALDVRNQCSGFLYGLSVAASFIASGQYNRILLVGSETHSRALDMTTEGRDMAVLFGDGAGAMILEPTTDPNRGFIGFDLHSDGAFRDALKLEAPTTRQMPMMSKEIIDQKLHYPKMEGKLVFKHAVTRMPESVRAVLSRHGKTPDDVNHYFFHQANLRINEACLKQLGQPHSKAVNNIERYGNCSAAVIPMCIDEKNRTGALNPGDLVCMAGFGAGFTWGSALMRW